MSIRTKVLLKILFKIVLLLVIAAGFVCVFLYYQSILEKSSHGIWAIPAFIAIFIVIIFKSKVVHLISDRDWIGEVKAICSVIDYEPITFFVAVGRRPPQKIPYTILTVLKDNGKTVKLKIQSRKMAPSLFKVGGKIQHLKGANYPIVLDSTQNVYICPCAEDG
jgi:hypothetical protein